MSKFKTVDTSNYKAVDTSNYKIPANAQTVADIKLRNYYCDELNAQHARTLLKARPL